MKKKTNSILFSYIMLLVINVLVIFAFLSENNIPFEYKNLWMLPLANFIGTCFLYKPIYIYEKFISVKIIFLGYYIKNVITPFFLLKGSFHTVYKSLPKNNIDKSVLIMTWEILFVCFVFFLITMMRNKNNTIKSVKKNVYKINSKYIWGLSLFVIFGFISFPILWDGVNTIFSNTAEIIVNDYRIDSNSYGFISNALITLTIFVMDFLRYLIPVCILTSISSSKFSRGLRMFFSVLTILSPFMLITGSNIQPFIGVIINVAVFFNLHGLKPLKIIILSSIIGGTILAYFFYQKIIIMGAASGAEGYGYMSMAFNAYFPGVDNLSAAYNIEGINRIDTLFSDIFSSIPFRYSLFPSISSKVTNLSDYFSVYGGARHQIIPFIYGISFYIGPILAPVVIMCIIFKIIHIEEKARGTDDYWKYVMYTIFFIRLSTSITVNSHISFLTMIVQALIPTKLIIDISAKKGSAK